MAISIKACEEKFVEHVIKMFPEEVLHQQSDVHTFLLSLILIMGKRLEIIKKGDKHIKVEKIVIESPRKSRSKMKT
jgi:hypothetical protein